MTAQTEASHTGGRRGDLVAGRYRIECLLGSGAAADVHRAFDEKLGRAVALKVLRPDAGPEAEARFAAEARMLALLDHPGLVGVYDYGHGEGGAYLVLRLVDGPTLRDLLASGPLSPNATAHLGRRLAAALAHVHGAGVVHRDVKPSNVLIDDSGEPLLTDFGISRLADGARVTRTGLVVGTAAYLAPEQVRGLGAGPPADVHALGLLLLECLKGCREYSGPPLEAAVARLHRRPAIPDGLPAGLAHALRAMLAEDPAQRPDAGRCAELLARPDRAPGTERRGTGLPGARTTTGPGDPAAGAGPGARGTVTMPVVPGQRRHRGPVLVGAAVLAATGLGFLGTAMAGSSQTVTHHGTLPHAGGSPAARPSASSHASGHPARDHDPGRSAHPPRSASVAAVPAATGHRRGPAPRARRHPVSRKAGGAGEGAGGRDTGEPGAGIAPAVLPVRRRITVLGRDRTEG